MYSVYVIKSEVDNRLYVGLSSDVNKRIIQHNSGKTKSTKGYRPWLLVRVEEIGNLKEAREREKHLKSGMGKEMLKSLYVNKKV